MNKCRKKKKKKDLAKNLGHGDFKATCVQLFRLKIQKDIKFKKKHGEKNSINTEKVQWNGNHKHCPHYLKIFKLITYAINCDETACITIETPNGSFSVFFFRALQY